MRALSFTDDVGGYAIVLCLLVLLVWLDPLLTEAWKAWQRRRPIDARRGDRFRRFFR